MESTAKKILIVDDSALNRALLSGMLQDDFDVIEAENGAAAMAILQERSEEIAIVLLDTVMPEMDGFEVLRRLGKDERFKTIRVIMITATNRGAHIERAYDLGAVDFVSRPFDERTVKHRVTSNYMLALKQDEVQDMLANQITQKEKDDALMIDILSNIVEYRNGESGLHVLHVQAITERLLKQLVKKTDKYPLTIQDIRLIVMASALHDIGKISVPMAIINKPEKLTNEEYAIMKHHTVDGAKMLKTLPFRKNAALVVIAYRICRWHHERYDGNGYPDGLKGDEIPIEAQVVSLADVYDALISRRVYKKAFPSDEAIAMIQSGECGAFNPILVECLTEIMPALNEELETIAQNESPEDELNESVQTMFTAESADISHRLVKQIEHERMKYKYLEDISHEITFEYVRMPEMIKLSDWSAESLKLPANIRHPLQNEAWGKIFPPQYFGLLLEDIHATTPQNEVVVRQFILNTGNGDKWNKVIAKAMWSTTDPPELEGAICKIIDVNDTAVTIKQLERRAEHDTLTGLYNHDAAKQRIQKLLSAKMGYKYALLFFDIDDFKQANDRFGHLFGDSVIETVADRIKKNTRSSDISARVGGDEFLIFMEYSSTIEPLVKRIFEKLTGDFHDFSISVSMGVACTETDGDDFETLLDKADTAMYAIKKERKSNYAFYHDGMQHAAPHSFTAKDHGDE